MGRVADGGLSHVFVPDHVSFFVGAGMDGLVQAASLTALDERVEVVLGVYLLALRHPVPVARQISTICEMAPGRLTLGVGVGGEDRHEIEVCGVDPKTRGRRTDECLAILRGLLPGEPFSFEGEFFQLDKAWIQPAPDPPVPILIGGRSNATVRRTAQYGDGWLATWVSPSRFEGVVAEVSERAAEFKRVDTRWQHGLQLWVGFDANPTRARERLAAEMEKFYRGTRFESFERYSPSGTPAQVVDFVAQYVDRGCSRLNIMPVAASTEAGIDAVAEVSERLGKAGH